METVNSAYLNNQGELGEYLQNQAWLLHIHFALNSPDAFLEYRPGHHSENTVVVYGGLRVQVVKSCIKVRAID